MYYVLLSEDYYLVFAIPTLIIEIMLAFWLKIRLQPQYLMQLILIASELFCTTWHYFRITCEPASLKGKPIFFLVLRNFKR